MEGMRQLDEFERLRSELPDLNARLAIVSPLIPPLHDLKPDELDVLQLAHNYGHVETVLNKSLATDLETVAILLKLLKARTCEPRVMSARRRHRRVERHRTRDRPRVRARAATR